MHRNTALLLLFRFWFWFPFLFGFTNSALLLPFSYPKVVTVILGFHFGHTCHHSKSIPPWTVCATWISVAIPLPKRLPSWCVSSISSYSLGSLASIQLVGRTMDQWISSQWSYTYATALPLSGSFRQCSNGIGNSAIKMGHSVHSHANTFRWTMAVVVHRDTA